jgi:hypothetical protein
MPCKGSPHGVFQPNPVRRWIFAGTWTIAGATKGGDSGPGKSDGYH